MTPQEALPALCQINEILRSELLRLQPERLLTSAIHPDDFSNLRRQVAAAARCLQLLPSLTDAVGEVESEMLEYKRVLEELYRFLPDIHARLLAERTRLQIALSHKTAAAKWAAASAGSS